MNALFLRSTRAVREREKEIEIEIKNNNIHNKMNLIGRGFSICVYINRIESTALKLPTKTASTAHHINTHTNTATAAATQTNRQTHAFEQASNNRERERTEERKKRYFPLFNELIQL